MWCIQKAFCFLHLSRPFALAVGLLGAFIAVGWTPGADLTVLTIVVAVELAVTLRTVGVATVGEKLLL